MSFVTGGLALAGLLAMAIPIVIFMFWRQRRTPIDWAAMRFLLEAYRKHRRRLRLEQLLLLALRCLVLAALGFALARPALKAAGLIDGGGRRVVYFVIDDGLVSGLELGDGATALDQHKEDALAVIESLQNGDRVGVITGARPARSVLVPPSTDLAGARRLIESLESGVSPTDLPGAMDRLRTALDAHVEDDSPVFAYLLTEFRAGSASLESALPIVVPEAWRAGGSEAVDDRLVLLAPPPADKTVANVRVTAVEPVRRVVVTGAASGSGQVTVRLARSGVDLTRGFTRVRLTGEGLPAVAPREVEWQPGQSEASCDFLLDLASLREREAGLTATIDEDALAADNDRFAILSLRRQLRAILVDRRAFGFEASLDALPSGQWIWRALEPGEENPVEVVEVEPAAFGEADARAADVAFLPRPDLLADAGWQAMRRFVDRGGLLVITPPEELTVHRWTDHLVDTLDLPFTFAREVRELEEPMRLADEQPVSELLRMISSDLSALCPPVAAQRILPLQSAGGAVPAALVFTGGEPFLAVGAPSEAAAGGETVRSRGLVICLAAPPYLGWANLPSKPLMVPLFHEIVQQGLSLVRGASASEVGGRPMLSVGPAAAMISRISRISRISGVPETAGLDPVEIPLAAGGRPERALPAAGIYRVLDPGRTDVGAVAVNVDARAGRTEPLGAAEVVAWLEKSGPFQPFDRAAPTAALARQDAGSPIAWALLLTVLALLLLEMVFARWFTHAGVRRTGVPGDRFRRGARAAGGVA